MEKDLGLVIAAGGSSSRFGDGNKLFQELDGIPVFMHCLKELQELVSVAVLVIPEREMKTFNMLLSNFPMTNVKVVHGGDTRSASVCNGIISLPESVKYAAITDAARPFVSKELLLRCVSTAREFGSGVAAHRVTDTIKVASPDGIVISTPDRSTLWAAETPQVFCKNKLLEAYRFCKEKGLQLTDDAQAFQEAGYCVRLVENSAVNIKITSREDLRIARLLCNKF